MARRYLLGMLAGLTLAGPAYAQTPSGLNVFRDELQRVLALTSRQRLDLIAPGLPMPGAPSESALRILFDGLPPGGSQSLTMVYATALEFAEAAPRRFTPAQRQQLLEAEQILLRSPSFLDLLLARTPRPAPSRKVLEYERYAMQVALAEQEAAADGSPASRLRLERLRRQWETYGHRSEVESAFERFHSITSADPALWLGNARERAMTASELMTHSPAAAVLAFGGMEQWTSPSGWTKVETANASGDSMTCELKRIALQRPWLEEGLFSSQHWRWQTSSPLPESTKLTGGNDGAALVPYIPVELLLARQCTVVMTGARLSIADPQIVGFVLQLPSSSPEPDPALWAQPAPPPRRVGWPVGIFHGMSFGQGGVNNQRGQVGPALYWFRPLSRRLSVLAGVAPGAKLRGPGLLVGGSVKLLRGAPLRAVAGFRFGSSGQRARFVIGLGLDLSLRADRTSDR